MKRIIFILILISVYTIQAQTWTPQKKDIKVPWAYTHQESGDTLAPMVYSVGGATDTSLTTIKSKLTSVIANLASLLAEQRMQYECVGDTVINISTAAALPTYVCDAISIQPQTAGLTLRYGFDASVATQGKILLANDSATIYVANASNVYAYCASANSVVIKYFVKR